MKHPEYKNKIGLVGLGQLGRYLGEAARKMNMEVAFFPASKDALTDPHFSPPQKWDHPILAWDQMSHFDRITYELEQIDLADLSPEIQNKLIPHHAALATFQHRQKEKDFFSQLGIPTTPYHILKSQGDATKLDPDKKWIFKSLTGGYDGKGQSLGKDSIDLPCIAEQRVDFAFEFSQGIARYADGTVKFFPPVYNYHEDSILRYSLMHPAFDLDCGEWLVKIAEKLNYVGFLCAEFFRPRNGETLINECAPRVHNSYHTTMDSCPYSQFEAHMDAVGDRGFIPENTISCTQPTLMFNILGKMPLQELQKIPDAKIYPYYKEERPKRKLGHINIDLSQTLPDSANFNDCLAFAESFFEKWRGR